ncbi:hypothetical protein Daus18300_014010 [Diaporthe australafricana]|uniref:Uncharacterized protein n=1 Tax=Diaporthe australafricana TaxID=127596 RepID=A0ABR3VX22_9PEZI
MRPALAIIKNLRVTRTLVRTLTKRLVSRAYAPAKTFLSGARKAALTLAKPYLPKKHPADEHPLKKHPLKLIIDTLHDDDDPWPVEWMMFNVLNDYLQPKPKLSVTQAAQCLDAIAPDNRPDLPGEEREPALNWMLEVSDLIWKVAKQIPYDHEGQDKLVQLIQALQQLPITATYYSSRSKVSMWRNHFEGWCDSERHSLLTPEKRKDPPKTKCDHYINANAFSARVGGAGMMKCCSYNFGYSAIETAFNGPINIYGSHSGDILSCHVIAGAQWIVHATEWLWSELLWGKIECCKVNKNGIKFPDYEPSLWVTWLRGFQQLAATGETGDVKYWTGQAAEKMEEMMHTHGFTAEMMETWDPEKRSLGAEMWKDERFAHLFKFPEKASKAVSETVLDPETAPETISETTSETASEPGSPATSETTSPATSETESEPDTPATSKATSKATSPATSEANSDEESDKA